MYIDRNLSVRSSVTFVHLFIGLFVYLFIHYSLDWRSSYLRAWYQRESGRTFIFWWEQWLIQNRPIPRTLPLSVSPSLFPSNELSRSLSLPITTTFCTISPHLSVSPSLRFPVFPRLTQCLFLFSPLSEFSRNAFFFISNSCSHIEWANYENAVYVNSALDFSGHFHKDLLF